MIDHIRANAELIISLAQKHLGRKLGYDQRGVEWLDGHIQKLRNDTNPARRSYGYDIREREYYESLCPDFARVDHSSNPPTPPRIANAGAIRKSPTNTP